MNSYIDNINLCDVNVCNITHKLTLKIVRIKLCVSW